MVGIKRLRHQIGVFDKKYVAAGVDGGAVVVEDQLRFRRIQRGASHRGATRGAQLAVQSVQSFSLGPRRE